MDEKDFKKHLRDLVHGHHHPEEHDWSQTGQPVKRARKPKSTKSVKTPGRKTARRAK